MESDGKLRLLYIAQLLYELSDEDHYISTNELIELLESKYSITSHRQTIKRDIEVLQDFGYDIKELKSSKNLYHLVSRKFDIAELRLLIDAVCSAQFITAKKCDELVDKISSLAGNYEAKSLRDGCCMDKLNRADNEKIYIIIDSINEAIKLGRKISFQYFSYDISKRKVLRHNGIPYIVSPLRLVWNGDHYYLIGIKNNGDRRNFRVDRIADPPHMLSVSADKAPEDFNLDEYLNRTIRMYDGVPREVTLRCDNSVIDVILDRFGQNTPITPVDDTCFTAKINVAVSSVFYGRVFGYGGLIKIVEPQDVAEEFNSMLDNFK